LVKRLEQLLATGAVISRATVQSTLRRLQTGQCDSDALVFDVQDTVSAVLHACEVLVASLWGFRGQPDYPLFDDLLQILWDILSMTVWTIDSSSDSLFELTVSSSMK